MPVNDKGKREQGWTVKAFRLELTGDGGGRHGSTESFKLWLSTEKAHPALQADEAQRFPILANPQKQKVGWWFARGWGRWGVIA